MIRPEKERVNRRKGSEIGGADPATNGDRDQGAGAAPDQRVLTEFTQRRDPDHETGDANRDAADEAGAARLDTGAWRGHSAAIRTWPARTSSVVFRTFLRSRRTRDVSAPLKTCFSRPQSRSEVPKNQSATG